MLLNLFAFVMGVSNPRIVHFITKHGQHCSEGQKVRHNIDQGFSGKFYSQMTCEGCGRQKEFRLHGFKFVADFIDEIHRDPKK
jgi:hypothetical protein